jgi:hypothetical protein
MMLPRVMLALVMIAATANGQTVRRLELVRCATGSDAPCFRVLSADVGRRDVYAISADAATTLGRSSTAGWRPPLLALPAFRGVADSAALSPAMREAVLLGNFGSNRPVIAVLLAVMLGFAWLLVIRLGWRDPLPVAARSHHSVTRTAPLASASEEADPRTPDEITQITARRTALRR